MPRLTVTEIASAVGVHKSTVSRQVRAAGLVDADGKIDLDAYKALRANALDPALQTARAPARLSESGTLSAERIRKLSADAELAEMQVRKARGELVEASSIDAATEDAFRRLRDLVLLVPRDVADDCARLGDAIAIEARIAQAIKARLREASALLTTEAAVEHAA